MANNPSKSPAFNNKIGIYNETDSLQLATIWGPIGVEAVLAQMYPPEISLFFDNMDVVKARAETIHYKGVLEFSGVNVSFARDILANSLSINSVNKKTVISALVQKAKDIQEKYKTKNVPHYQEVIETLVEDDILRYGVDQALNLNWKLSLNPILPLGNLLYARDQMNVLFNTRFSSNMKKDIRRGEVSLYEMVYKKTLGSFDNKIAIPSHETFEGGDAYIHDNTIFIGVGPRTTLGAAIFIFNTLKRQIKELGYKFVIVEDILKRGDMEQMLYMHLDTFSNPVGKRQIAVCLSEAKRRRIKIVTLKSDDTIEIHDTQKSFLDYLMETQEEIIAVPDDEQYTFGCNFLSINENHIFVPLATNKQTIEGLQKIGKKVTYVHLDECTKGFGAAHCMTGQLKRTN